MKKQLATFSTLPAKIPPLSHRDAGGNTAKKDIVGVLIAAWNTVIAAFREIFDEAAYDRFLVRTGKSRSADSYRQFMVENEASVARKPRCC